MHFSGFSRASFVLGLATLLASYGCGSDGGARCKGDACEQQDNEPEDLCPNDESKTEPGVCGCGVPEVDNDEDGVFDCEDTCPGDNRVDADSDGNPDACDPCPVDANDDSDFDGSCDSQDDCPHGNDDFDTDEDGTPNGCDACPFDAAKVTPGLCGCGLSDADTDNDDVLDCDDGCPMDATKLAPGVCGCGVPDIDSDSDGVLNCADVCDGDDTLDGDGDDTPDACDACPADPLDDSDGDGSCDSADACAGADDNADNDSDNTPDGCDACDDDSNKVSVGQCGCGAPDTDTDGDGTADCNDECVDDPDKTAPGTCGCGQEEVAFCGNPPTCSGVFASGDCTTPDASCVARYAWSVVTTPVVGIQIEMIVAENTSTAPDLSSAWSGVGFSRDGTLTSLDLAVARNNAGACEVYDAYLDGTTAAHDVDSTNTVTSGTGGDNAGLFSATYYRTCGAGDASEIDVCSEPFFFHWLTAPFPADDSGGPPPQLLGFDGAHVSSEAEAIDLSLCFSQP